MSSFVTDSTGLVQERWAHDFSIGSGLVLDEVAGIFRLGFSGITAHLAKWGGSGDGGGIAGSSGGRHCFDSIDCF